MVRERLKVENITERYRKARLRWFGHGQRETVGREHHREVQESKTEVVWTWSGRDEGREHHREVQESKTEVVWTWSGRD